jgi:hypothetical protein
MTDFHRRFSIDIGEEEARKRFVRRIENIVFESFFHNNFNESERWGILRSVATILGDKYVFNFGLQQYSGGDFLKTLQTVEALCEVRPHHQDNISKMVTQLLNLSESRHWCPLGGGQVPLLGCSVARRACHQRTTRLA